MLAGDDGHRKKEEGNYMKKESRSRRRMHSVIARTISFGAALAMGYTAIAPAMPLLANEPIEVEMRSDQSAETFATSFPAETITAQSLVYRNEGDLEWKAYDESVELNEKSRLAIRVEYEGLSKAAIKAEEGKFVFALPEILMSTEDSEKGSPLVHTNTNGDVQTHTTIGSIKSCKDDPAHVHVHMDQYKKLGGKVIEKGAFNIETKLNLDAYRNNAGTEIKIGDQTYTLNIADSSVKDGAEISGFSFGADTSTHADGIHDLGEGKLQADYVMDFTTGDQPVTDAVIDGFMSEFFEVCSFVPGSIKLIDGENEQSIAGNEDFQLVISPIKMFAPEDTNGWTKGIKLSYTDANGQQASHAVPDQGFSAYLGELKRNTHYQLKYSILIDTTSMIGKESTFKNGAQIFSSEAPRTEVATTDISLSSFFEIQTVLDSTTTDEQGNVYQDYTVNVKAPADNDYAFKNVEVDELLVFKEHISSSNASIYNDYISVESGSARLYKANGREPQESDRLDDPTVVNGGTENAKKRFRINIGDMTPGDQAKLTYRVFLKKGFREYMGEKKVDVIDFNSNAYIERRNSRLSGKVYRTSDEVLSTFKGPRWMDKTDMKEDLSAAKEISMSGSTVYDGTAAVDTDAFTVPANSIGYQVAINPENAGDIMNSTFKDTLSKDGAAQTEFGYTGFMQVDLYHGAQNNDRTPLKTVYVKLPEGADTFTFKPADYPEIKNAANGLVSGMNVSMKLTYYVKPLAGSPIRSTLTSTMNATGIKARYKTVDCTRTLTSFTAPNMQLSMKTAGLAAYEPEAAHEIFTDGRLGWIIRLDGDMIPKGTVVRSSLGEREYEFRDEFRRDYAVYNIYKSKEDFATVPFSGFDNLQQNDPMKRDPNLYTQVTGFLAGDELPKTSYKVAVSGGSNEILDLTFNEDIEIAEDEYVYIVLNAVLKPAMNYDWHPDRQSVQTHFTNDTYFRFGDMNAGEVNHADLYLSNDPVVRKNWGETFVWTKDGASIMDSKTSDGDIDLSTYTSADVMTPIINDAVAAQSLEMKERSAYVDWRITADLNDEEKGKYPFKSKFTFNEVLGDHQEYVGCFLTSDENGTVTANPARLKIDKVEQKDVNGVPTISVTVSGVKAGQNYTLHMITRSTTGWDTLMTAETPETLSGEVKAFNYKSLIAKSADSVELSIKGVVDNASVEMSEAEQTEHGYSSRKFETVFNSLKADLDAGADTLTLNAACDSTLIGIETEDVHVTDANGNAIEGITVSADESGLHIAGVPDETEVHLSYIADINVEPGQSTNLNIKTSWNSVNSAVNEFSEVFTNPATGISFSKGEVEEETFDLSILDFIVTFARSLDEIDFNETFELIKSTLPKAEGELENPTDQEGIDASAAELNSAIMQSRRKPDEDYLKQRMDEIRQNAENN